jgi:hypothetical protein
MNAVASHQHLTSDINAAVAAVQAIASRSPVPLLQPQTPQALSDSPLTAQTQSTQVVTPRSRQGSSKKKFGKVQYKLKLQPWFLRTVYDFTAARASFGWKAQLRIYNIVRQAKVFGKCTAFNLASVQSESPRARLRHWTAIIRMTKRCSRCVDLCPGFVCVWKTADWDSRLLAATWEQW